MDNKGKQKMTKPLVEKRRRARINNSLADLKNLILTVTQETGMQCHRSKWEKADILEMAVFHFRRLQRTNKALNKNDEMEPFKEGFRAAVGEVVHYMDTESVQVNQRLVGHLQDKMQGLGDVNSNNQSGNCIEMKCSEKEVRKEDCFLAWRPWNRDDKST